MLKTEVSEVMNKDGLVYQVAEKVNYNLQLSNEEKDVFDVCDAWAREIGKTGYDKDHEIAAFITKTINDEIYNAPDELLDSMFERGTIGEFDDYEATRTPINTLVAYEAAKGGTVDRSWLDFGAVKPTTKNRQVETDISFADLRRNGFKSVATLTTYAEQALKNAMFYDIFNTIDTAITGGEQAISVVGAAPTQEAMDALALYLTDRNASDAMVVALNKYAKAIGRMDGFAEYMSDAMKNDFNRYGLVDFYGGVRVAGISGANKVAGKQLLIPDKRIFGVAGKIGNLDMKGEVHVYEDTDNQREQIHLMVKDFTYSYCITDIDKVAKITLE